ncbi:siderophore ABC transporter substrate-binding protein [Bacillus kwashiorkori]|uniref:siderophore ABC transporter substrate-binding protein n=1 Tax=Bacillus kwashiorkori TaxID=1522318 RepID=UPI00078250A6|nr:siderophore ABC transporter substrate-binding protein [Bacillus kwashiorkori]
MRKITLSSIILLFIIMLAACGNGADNSSGANNSEDTITINHELGETKVKKNPQKIVVFDFGMLDTLDKMGIEITALPKVTIPPYLNKYEAEKYMNVGSLKEPDFEKIAELGPDLIIISTRQAELYEEFDKIGPTLYINLDYTNYMESFKENVQTVAKIFGKEDFVKNELATLDKQIESVKEKVTATNKNALIILANEGKISAYGPNSRFGLIHDVLGFAPVDTNIEVSTHGQSISFEYIVDKDPEYLFVIDRTAAIGGETAAKEFVENDLTKKTKAFKNGKVFYLDANYWYLSGGGLISVSEMVKEIENTIK